MNFKADDFAKLAILAIEEQWDLFPEPVYEHLPSILRDACSLFKESREKDVFLSGASVVLGGCFHNLIAYNLVDKKAISPNLFFFTIAPPASGKRSLQYSKKMADKIKQTFQLNSIYTKRRKARKLFIPANTSQAGMIEMLDKNAGIGIMIESEIDTLVNANRQDWGNFTDVIRNAFENESYSIYRKTKSFFAEIDRVQLSLALSGTKGQFKNLINSVDDGLFSRGCYYMFDDREEVLKSFGRMNTDIDVDERFASFANVLDGYYRKAMAFEKIQVSFGKEEMQLVQDGLQVIYSIIVGKEERGFEANVKRAFSIVLKIATILTFLEKCEEDSLSEQLNCSPNALGLSMMITLVYLIHANNVYDILASNTALSLNKSQQRLYYVLGDRFTQEEVLNLAQDIGLKERTAYNSIKGLEKKGWIALEPDGNYKKLV